MIPAMHKGLLISGALALALLLACGDDTESTETGSMSSLIGGDLTGGLGGSNTDNNTGDGPGGDRSGAAELGCNALFECVNPCQDQACVTACVDRAYPEAAQLLASIYECAQGCGQDDSCFQQRCGSSANQCLADTRGPARQREISSDLSCQELFNCVDTCGEDEICSQGCVNRTTPEGIQQARAVVDCGNACQWEDACLNGECAFELQACR
jgi:hypothetical protein